MAGTVVCALLIYPYACQMVPACSTIFGVTLYTHACYLLATGRGRVWVALLVLSVAACFCLLSKHTAFPFLVCPRCWVLWARRGQALWIYPSLTLSLGAGAAMAYMAFYDANSISWWIAEMFRRGGHPATDHFGQPVLDWLLYIFFLLKFLLAPLVLLVLAALKRSGAVRRKVAVLAVLVAAPVVLISFVPNKAHVFAAPSRPLRRTTSSSISASTRDNRQAPILNSVRFNGPSK